MECTSKTESIFINSTICNVNDPDNNFIQVNEARTDGSVMLCPLCNSEIKQFFINFNEKTIMCENTSCEYPFGHEPLQYFKENNEIESDDEVMSIRTGTSLFTDANGTLSVTGNTACWSEINQLIKANESEENEFNRKSHCLNKNHNSELKGNFQHIDEDIKNNIKAISELTKELSSEKHVIITNKKWIENLQSMQMCTKREMVKPLEVLNCKPAKVFGGGELKIDISSNANEMSSITIEIKNTENC